jgi:hypothetical protein
MRTTTELTARFNLNLNLVGTREIDDFFAHRDWTYDEQADDCYMPAPTQQIVEAINTEEDRALDGEEGLIDALDFDTVPFERVEADLAVELFEQDLADDREWDHHSVLDYCTRTGLTLRDEQRRERERRAHEQAIKRSRERARRFRAALAKAKELRPDLDWSRYDHIHFCPF